MIHPAYATFLATLDGQGPLDGAIGQWRRLLLDSTDLLAAAMADDAGATKTAAATITRRVWPDSSTIPSQVRTSLGVLRVEVRW